jgi:DNA-binding MarR family transcriptional regulator
VTTNKRTRTTSKAPVTKNDVLQLEDLLGYNLRRAHGVQRARFASVFGPYRIRPVQLSILGLLHEKTRLKQSELAKTLEIKPANMVTLLNELEQRNLIVRQPTSADRRSRALALTPAGRKLTGELLALHASLEKSVTEYLSVAERDALLRLLKKFRRAPMAPDLGYDER